MFDLDPADRQLFQDRPPITPSRFQEAIFDWVEHGAGHGVVEAKAGSGKTTTAVESIKRIKPHKRVAFVAFNRAIADELRARVPQNCHALTLNGLGHRAWMRRAGRNVELVADKTRRIMNDLLPRAVVRLHGANVRKLVSLAKSFGLVPEGVAGGRGLVPDSDEVWSALVERFDVEVGRSDAEQEAAAHAAGLVPDDVVGMARSVLALSCERMREIDYDDQLYFPVCFGAPVGGYDWLFVDEAQDLSPIQHALVERAVVPGGRIVAIGDSRQAIYSFRGADSESMQRLRDRLSATSMDLSICYRCPQSHVRLAQTIVPDIEAAPSAPEGEIVRLGTRWKAEDFRPTDLVVCRAGAPLVTLAYRLLTQKVAVRIRGRDLGVGLVSLIRKLDARDLKDLHGALAAWHEQEVARMLARDPEAPTDAADDKRDCIEAFIGLFPRADVDGLCDEIGKMFSDEFGAGTVLTLSTIHRAKGLEAPRVWILNHGISDALLKRETRPWLAEAERNLQYVAFTRSTGFLGFIEVERRGRR